MSCITCHSKKIRPLENRVLVERTAAKTMTKGGILLPTQEKPQEGTVVAVGPGKVDEKGNLVPVDVQVGDVVLFAPYAGVEVEEGSEYLVLSEDDLLAVLS